MVADDPGEVANPGPGVGNCRDVRGDKAIFQGPERAVLGQRLHFEHVKAGGPQRAVLEGGNDIGFENIFARQVEGLGNKGDVLIAISTSGKSENVNRAIAEAKKKGMTVIGFLGKGGGASKDMVDVPIIIPSDDTQRIQEGHITVAHIICGIVENEMFG